MTSERDDKKGDALAKIEKAFQHVFDICKGKERWTMRIPARPDMDSDLIICDALNAARTALSAVARSEPVAWWLTGDKRHEDCLFFTEKWARDTCAARLRLTPDATLRVEPLCVARSASVLRIVTLLREAFDHAGSANGLRTAWFEETEEALAATDSRTVPE